MTSATQVFNIEHKTSGIDIAPGAPYWKKLTLDSQVSDYDVGVRALGYEPIGTLYDVVRKITLRPYIATPMEEREYTKAKDRGCKECRKKNPAPLPHTETVGEGDDAREVQCVEGRIITDPGGRLYATMREFDETADEFRARVRADIAADPEKYYQRATIVRLEDERREALKNTWDIARQIRESQLADRWPQNPEACHAYGSFCSYWSVCTNETSIDDPLRYRDAEEHEELTKPGDEKRRLPLLSTSSKRAYRACQRKYFYSYEKRRRSIEDANALRFGTVFHAGLEVWWKTVDLAAAFEAMAALYATKGIDPIDAIKAEELLRGYHARWSSEPLTVVAVEAEFRTQLVNPDTGRKSETWELGGKIDAIVLAPGAAHPQSSAA